MRLARAQRLAGTDRLARGPSPANATPSAVRWGYRADLAAGDQVDRTGTGGGEDRQGRGAERGTSFAERAQAEARAEILPDRRLQRSEPIGERRQHRGRGGAAENHDFRIEEVLDAGERDGEGPRRPVDPRREGCLLGNAARRRFLPVPAERAEREILAEAAAIAAMSTAGRRDRRSCGRPRRHCRYCREKARRE